MADLETLLFTVDAPLALRAKAAGIAGFVVDWEDRNGDAQRSAADDGVGPDTLDDLKRMAGVPDARLFCRINALNDATQREIDRAVQHGATDILVPMVETPAQVEQVVSLVDGRAGVGVMIETHAACERSAEIARVPVDFVYVGLLDLAIDRREANVFRPLADGTADRLRDAFADARFGIGGVTVVDGGSPVPCAVLMGELARLRTDFVFARRSFKRDMAGRDMALEYQRIRTTWQALVARDVPYVDADHVDFIRRFGASSPRWGRATSF